MRCLLLPLLVLFAPLCWSEEDIAKNKCPNNYAAKVVSLQGTLYFDPDGKRHWQPAQLNETLCEGSRVQVEANSRASLLLTNGITLRLGAGTVLSLNGLVPDKPTLLELFKGFVHFISRTPKRLQINTPIANAGPEGTEFAMSVDDNNASLWVYEGGVKFFNDKGSVRLSPGQGGQAQKGQAPQAHIDIKPKDAVNWALYYPPILPYPDAATNIDSDIRTAVQDFRQGRSNAALSRLNRLPPAQQTPYFHKVRGAILLSVGQDKLALQDIHTLLAHNPNDAEALALQSVIALTQNRKDEAYTLANRAVSTNPQSATAYSALSYAEQGRFQLDKAQSAANQATKLAPHDAMVWARKAELELAQGLTSQSQETAERALVLDANLERTQTVTGFTYLLRMDTDEALHSFKKAIELDSSSPLARLGLGLAKIRDGDLAEGRQDLEIATILDPNNALIRSYLGKAYYEERRNPLAEDQFKLAKERDPKDPTPYFYDALKKQTENRPVEALYELQKSIELNNNRSIFRSKQLLDQDLAIRGTSIARVFNTLGLEKRGIIEASKSLTLNPSDYSSHRFLSDVYVNIPRQRIAQVSELLQAQLLQPININPVQPHLSVTGLGSISGVSPAETGFKDFTRVFDRNRPQLTTTGVAGNKNTFSDEAVLAGLYKNLSYSIGQFHYQTDGFRPKANIDPRIYKTDNNQNIYDVFLQAALTDKFNLQFEYINQDINQANQTLSISNILPNDLPLIREKLNLETVRGGLHWTISPQSDLIASIIYSNRKENVVTENPTLIDYRTETRDGFTGELQHISRHSFGNVVIGGGAYNLDGTFKNAGKTIADPLQCTFFPLSCTDPLTKNSSPDFYGHNAYLYSNIKFLDHITATLGISYDTYKRNQPDAYISRINPKIGLQWDVSDHFRFRTTYFQTVKRLLAADQTIEPTQIAGFNQLYDDFNGTRSDFFGIALDGTATKNFYGGIEFNHRKLRQLSAPTGENAKYYNHKEDRYRGYLFWSPVPRFALNLEYQHERHNGDLLKLETDTLPLSIKYFDPSGFFATIKTTYVWQKTVEEIQQEEFLVVDSTIGYRLPKRWGILSLEARNIFDRHFQYKDLSDISSDRFSVQRPYLPERTFFARITVNFD